MLLEMESTTSLPICLISWEVKGYLVIANLPLNLPRMSLKTIFLTKRMERKESSSQNYRSFILL